MKTTKTANKRQIIKEVRVMSNPNNLRGDQQGARTAMVKWLNDPTQRIFTLTGDAGTGKTYLLDTFLREDVKVSFCITAPTHRALKVFEKATGRTGKTFQAIHALRPNVSLESFDLNNLTFDSFGKDKFGQYKLFIVDECSQVNAALFALTDKRSLANGTKILYIGDKYQTPPIKERLSLTFTVANTYNLTEIIRQEDTNPLHGIFSILKSDIDNGTSNFLTHIKDNPSNMNELGEGYVCLNQRDFIDSILPKFNDSKFKNDVDYIRYAGRTNVLTNSLNAFIREQIFGKDSIIKVGDLLTGYKTVVNEYFDPILTNSEDYVVKSFGKYVSEHGFVYYRVKGSAITEEVDYTFNVVDHTDPTYRIFVNRLTSLYNAIMNVPSERRAKYWAKYNEFKNMYLTLVKIDIKCDGKIKVATNELDYGYGLTVHKIQGTTVENMAINLVDICNWDGDKTKPIKGVVNVELRNKMIYTATTRASKAAIFLI